MTSQAAIDPGKPVARGATASLVCGILSFTPAWLLAGIPAIVLGHQARKAIAAQPNTLRGARRSKAGLVLGYLSIAATPVIAILIISAGLFLGAVPSIRQATKKTYAKNTSSQLVVALNAYVTEYQHLPIDPKAEPAKDEELDNLEVMDVLRNVNSERNPRKIVFFEGSGISGGMLIDPWGNRYHIAVDRDGDGKVDVIGMSVSKPIIVWSDGVNGEDDRGVGDDVTSW